MRNAIAGLVALLIAGVFFLVSWAGAGDAAEAAGWITLTISAFMLIRAVLPSQPVESREDAALNAIRDLPRRKPVE